MRKNFFLLIFFICLIISYNNLFSAWRQIKNITPSSFKDKTYLDVFFLENNPNYGWVCGFEGIVLRTTDGGISWIGTQISPGSNFQLESINFLNEKVGYVSGPYLSGNLIDVFAVIFKTVDGGATWFNVSPHVTNNFWGNFFFDENNGILLAGSCENQLFYRTTDGGSSWSYTSYQSYNTKLSDAYFAPNSQYGYAISSGVLWESSNSGLNWRQVSNTGPRDWHEDFAIYGNTILLPVSLGCDGTTSNNGGLAISKDLGKTWMRVNYNAPMFGSFLLNENLGWVVGFNRSIYKTTDGGDTWNIDICGIPDGVDLDDILFLNDNKGWVVGTGIYEYYIPEHITAEITSPNLFICEGDSTTLEVSGLFDSYKWNTGETTPKITVNKPGIYKVRVKIDSICYEQFSNELEVVYYPKKDIEFEILGDYPPCESDTITIIAKGSHRLYKWQENQNNGSTITITKSGTYTVDVIDSNGCTNSKSIDIVFNPRPEPNIINSYRDTLCIGYSTTLFSEFEHSQYEWIEMNSGRVVSNEREIQVNEAGRYMLKVRDNNNCEGFSNFIDITFVNLSNLFTFEFKRDNTIDIDSTYYSKINCGYLTIKNISDTIGVINDLFIFKNIAFSVPLSQLPLVVLPRDSINLKVCFSPQKLGKDTDTLLIIDVCSNHLVNVESYGILNSFSANTKCEVVIDATPSKIGNQSKISFMTPTPNPASSFIRIPFEIIKPIDFDIELKPSISNVLGNIYKNYNIEIISEHKNNDTLFQNGIITFDISKLSSGTYLFLCKIQNEIVSIPINIQR